MARHSRKPASKVILIGDAGVGKTSIFSRFQDDSFCPTLTTPTLMIDSCPRTVYSRGNKVNIILWDTAGTERFRTLTRNYFHGAHVCLLVYDVKDSSTLYNLTTWICEANLYAQSARKFVVGNKMDMWKSSEHAHLREEEEHFAESFDCDRIFKVSAKTGMGMDELYAGIAEILLDRVRTSDEATLSSLSDYGIPRSTNRTPSAGCQC